MFQRLRLSRPSLHASVLATIVLTCCILVGLDGWRTWNARVTILTEDKAETANLAASLAQHAHDVVQIADTVLLGLRERVQTDGTTPQSLQRLHHVMSFRLADLPIVHGLFLYDAKGDWLASSLPSMPASLNNSDREYFRYHRDHPDRSVYVGRPVHSKSDGSWILTVSRRVDDSEGRFTGIVLATISIDYLNAFYAKFDVGAQGSVTLATAEGLIVARKNVALPEIGMDLSQGQLFREFIPQSSAGSFKYMPVSAGVERLGSFRRVDGYPLIIVVAHGFDEVLAPWRADAAAHLSINLIFVAGLGLIGYRLTGHIKARQEVEHRYRLLADNSSDAIACTNLTGCCTYVSPAFTALTGWSIEEALSQDLRSLIHPDDHAELEAAARRLRNGEGAGSVTYRYICKSGAPLWVEAKYHLVSTNKRAEAQVVSNIRDISARKLAEERLASANEQLALQANTDSLTGLWSRRRFDETLAREWKRAARDEQPLSLLLLDVDRFKVFNDTYGHLEGDRCLQAVSAVISRSVCRPGDLVARYGGEEIVVLMSNTEALGAAQVAEAVRAGVQAAAITHDGNLPWRVVTISVGVATLWPTPSMDVEDARSLIGAADSALYEAKRTGRNRLVSAADVPSPPVASALLSEQQ